MDDTLSQKLSLISYGNEYINTGNPAPCYNQHAVFKYCKKLSFKTYKESFFSKEKAVAAGNNPEEWFQFLKKDDCRELKLFYQHTKDQSQFKDYKTAGLVGGGGTWLIEAVYKKYSDFWYAHWNYQQHENPEQQGWLVEYEAVARKKPTINLQLLLNPVKNELKEALQQTEQFARQEKLDNWADCFAKALTELESEGPGATFYYPDLLINKNYDITARQLIFGAAQSWVFGGMGSWNDLGFDGPEKNDLYEQLSETLFEKVTGAIIAGINSY
ncbi:MAG: hypothetical protein JNK27_06500 [Chitinophagaceae bacterium]|nr:hypothetical protein [Chitinophagaceae bacterium]